MYKKQLQNRKDVLSFKKWSRASYAVFKTVSREVSVRVLSLGCLTAIGVVQVCAQDNVPFIEEEKVDLNEVVVSAEAVPQLQSEIARVVTVVNKKDIQASGATSLSDLLECVLNVDVRQRGLHGVQSDISIRGGSFDQVMVLLNGINISDPQTGHHNMNIPVNLNAVERIEVLNGPGAKHLGANAFSGAINIITSSVHGNQASANLAYGSFDYIDGNINASFDAGAISSFISFGERESDGYIQNTDFDNVDFFYHGSAQIEDGKFDFQFGHQDKQFGSNSFYTPKWPDQFEHTSTTFTSLKYSTGTKLKLTPSIYFRLNKDVFELFREDIYQKQGDFFVAQNQDTAKYYPNNYADWNYYGGHNYHQTNVFGSNLNATYYWDKLGKTSFGANLRSEKILSNSLSAYELNDPLKVLNQDAYYTKSFSRANQSIYVEHVYNHKHFNVGLGVMGNYNTSINTGMTFYPGLDLNIHVYKGLRFKLSGNKSLRIPSFTDLFYNGSSNVGNAFLLPETAITYEGGLKYTGKGINTHFTVFSREGSNLIDWVKSEDETKWHTENLLDMTTLGSEFFLQLHPNALFKINSPIQALTLSSTSLTSDKESGEYMSKYVMDYLSFKASGSITLFYKHLFLNVEYNYQEREGGYELFVDKVSQGDVAYEPYGLLNAKLWYQFPWVKVFVEGSNILDKDYVDIGNIAQPGTWIRAGVQLKVDFND